MHLVLKNLKQIVGCWKGEVFAEFLEVKIAENCKCKHYLCKLRKKSKHLEEEEGDYRITAAASPVKLELQIPEWSKPCYSFAARCEQS